MPAARQSSSANRPSPSAPADSLPLLLLVLVSLLIVALLVYRYQAGRSLLPPTNPPTPLSSLPQDQPSSPSPAPSIKPIPTGPFTYQFMTGRQTGPLYQSLTLNPYDPSPNTPQTITVKINSQNPVKTVKATLQTDNKSSSQFLTLLEGNTSSGTWQTTFTHSDSYNYIYKIILEAEDDAGEVNKNDVILR